MTPGTRPFGRTAAGAEVQALTIAAGDLRARILTLGAALQDLRLAPCGWPLTLGGQEVAAYEGPMAYFGTVVGPVANRIAGARAEVAGRSHRFDANDGPNTLHGGRAGTQAALWRIAAAGPDRAALVLDLADGQGGFPGNRRIAAEYRAEAPARLRLALTATSDAPTLINLAHHGYWNLDGALDTAGHRLTVPADRYTPVDAGLIPSGAVLPVAGTEFDLRGGITLGPQTRLDHNFCLADAPRPLAPAAFLEGRRGLRLALSTTAPGLQVYDGAGLCTAPHPGHAGRPYGARAGVALEAQHWPDAPHHPGFPPILLRPGETWRQETLYDFALP